MTELTKVWVCGFTADPRPVVPITVMPGDRDKFDMGQDELDRLAAVSRDYREAVIKDANLLPKVLTGRKLDTELKNLPDFFIGAGFYIASEKCADVFRKFDLGYGGFSPVTISQGDRKSFISGQHYHILYFGCQKQAFIPDLSNPVAFYRKGLVRGGYLRYSGTIDDGDCALSAQALEGPDLWIDLTVALAFFLSSRLVEALKAAGLSKNMSLKRCKVID